MGAAQTVYQLLLLFPLVYQEMAAESHLTFDLSPQALYLSQNHGGNASLTKPSARTELTEQPISSSRMAQCLAFQVI